MKVNSRLSKDPSGYLVTQPRSFRVFPSPRVAQEKRLILCQSLFEKSRVGIVASLAASLVFLASPSVSCAAQEVIISNANPVLDLAKVIPREQLPSLVNELKSLEDDLGYRVRLFTRYGLTKEAPTFDQVRSGWNTSQPKTIIMLVDPSAPNLMQFKFTSSLPLPRPFFTELSSKYGNMFTVRRMGESAAVLTALEAITTCLRQGGCNVVPGLAEDEYIFTLVCCIAGGILAGSAARIQPQGFVKSSFIWALLFSPLWGILFISFGLGPVLQRTDEIQPVIQNIAAFISSASIVYFQQFIAQKSGFLPSIDNTEE